MNDPTQEQQTAAVIGCGTWGLSLACLLAKKGIVTCAWDAFPDYIQHLQQTRWHDKLPDLSIPSDLNITNDLKCVADAKFFVLAPASHGMRPVCELIKQLGIDLSMHLFVICTKGIEEHSMKPMAEVVTEVLGESIGDKLVVLSGPSHAEEVSRDLPTTVVAASKNAEAAASTQSLFMCPFFRVYTHDDVLGVELGGSLKNVIAIAAGICDGLGFGDNSRAALITRGLAEITRLGVAMGARADTFSGLAGIGDLIVTAGSRHSRNHNFGQKIAQGLTMQQAQQEIGMVVEGIRTCVSAMELSQKYNIELPITSEVYEVLYNNKSPQRAVRDLMLRDPKPEAERLRNN